MSTEHRSQTTTEPLDLIPAETYAKRIGWHVESLRRACRQGRVKAVKLGREWRIPRSEVDRISQNGIPVSVAA